MIKISAPGRLASEQSFIIEVLMKKSIFIFIILIQSNLTEAEKYRVKVRLWMSRLENWSSEIIDFWVKER